jgi:hypothetical protein
MIISGTQLPRDCTRKEERFLHALILCPIPKRGHRVVKNFNRLVNEQTGLRVFCPLSLLNLFDRVLENDLNRLKKHILPTFGHMRLDQIKTMHIVNFINDLRSGETKRSENTILTYIKC